MPTAPNTQKAATAWRTYGGDRLAEHILTLNPTTSDDHVAPSAEHVTTPDEAAAFLRATHSFTIRGFCTGPGHNLTVTPTHPHQRRTDPGTGWTITLHRHQATDLDAQAFLIAMNGRPENLCILTAVILHTGHLPKTHAPSDPPLQPDTRFLTYYAARAWAHEPPDLTAHLTPDDRAALITTHTTPTAWAPWAELGYTPRQATMYLSTATPDQAEPWLRLGFTDYNAARRAAAGQQPHFNPADYQAVGVHPTAARNWYSRFALNPDQAATLTNAGISATEFIAALNDNTAYPPDDTDAADLVEWVEQDVALEDVTVWRGLTIDLPTAAAWTHLGYTPTKFTNLARTVDRRKPAPNAYVGTIDRDRVIAAHFAATTTPDLIAGWTETGVPENRLADALTCGHLPDNCPPDTLTTLRTQPSNQ